MLSKHRTYAPGRAPALAAVIALAALSALGCDEDLNIEGKRFACDSDGDCLPGYRCAAGVRGTMGKVCQPTAEADAIEPRDLSDPSDLNDTPDTTSPCDALACAPTQTCCVTDGQAACVDTQTDPAHCGGCGQACGLYEACTQGLCACGAQVAQPRQTACSANTACCEDTCSLPDLPRCACDGKTCP